MLYIFYLFDLNLIFKGLNCDFMLALFYVQKCAALTPNF